MTFVTGVPSYEVPQVWPRVKQYIESGLMDGGNVERLFDRIMRRECALWAAKIGDKIIAACVTETVILDNRKICNVISIGGVGMAEWLREIVMIEAWAAENKCRAMRFEPPFRDGWKRVLTDYRLIEGALEKAL